MDDFFQVLGEKRRAEGLSLEDLFDRTRINPEFLDALETGRFDVLPEAYIRLFLKKYAQEVGLNASEILDQYETYIAPPHEIPPPSYARQNQTSSPFLFISLGLGLVAVLAFLFYKPWTEEVTQDPGQPPVAVESLPGARLQERQVETSLRSQIGPAEDSPSSQKRPDSVIPTVPTEPANLTPAIPEPSNADSDLIPEATEEIPIASSTPSSDSSIEKLPEQTPLEISSEPALDSNPPDESIEVRERIIEAYSLPFSPVLLNQDSLLTLSGKMKETTTVFVSADGEEIFSGILPAGRLSRWRARDRFLVEVQNASALSLTLQGLPLESQNPSRNKRRLFISRSSIWVEEMETLPAQLLSR